MKKKIGILIEEGVMRLAQYRAAEEGRSLSDVIQDALVSYLSDKAPDRKKREKAYQFFCDQPIRVSRKQLKKITEADTYK